MTGSRLLLFPDSFFLLLLRDSLVTLIHLPFNLEVLFLCPAALPAVFPVTDQKLETEGVYLHAGLEANTKIAVIHLILIDIRMEEVEMAGDGEEEIVVIWGEF